MGDAVIITNPHGELSFLNPAAEKLTGWALPDCLGKPLPEVFPCVDEETRQPVDHAVVTVPQAGAVNALTPPRICLRPKAGSEVPMVYSAALIRDPKEHVLGVVFIFRDISERRRAESLLSQTEGQLSSLMTTTQDAVITIDQHGCIDTFNPAAERIFGYTRAEVQGQKVQLLMPEPYASEHDAYVVRYQRTGNPQAIGRVRTVAVRSVIVSSSTVLRAVDAVEA
jgi:PAS domain S-box-containing protein